MSIDIGLVSRLQGASATPAGASAPANTEPEATGDREDAVAVDTFPAAPPPELSAAIGTAARAYDDLAASGRQLHFAMDSTTSRLASSSATPPAASSRR